MVYRFERYRLDVPRRELSRDGVPIPLRPKVFALLALLVEERERVVERDELFERLWAGRIVSDATLSSCVKELRRALDDTGRERRYIGTAHGEGFRFLAQLERGDPETSDTQAPRSNEATTPEPPQSFSDEQAPTTVGDVARSERKTVSVLRCALLDADSTAERLGSEATHRLMQALLAGIGETVERYDGEVTQWLSDGCLALFGVPVAHDDDARRAVHAAADVHTRCSELLSAHDATIACGVTSGVAVVGALPGEGGRQHYASASLLRAAERLCFAAGDGRTAIDERSFRHVRETVRVRPLESDDRNATGWIVQRIVEPRAGVPRRFRRAPTPLIGREREMALLTERLGAARCGSGAAFGLVGPAGIGKTRLIEAFSASLGEADTVIAVRCVPEHRHTQDRVLAELLRRLCGVRVTDDETHVARALGRVSDGAGVRDETTQALLRSLLRPGDPVDVPTTLSPKARRDALESALSRLVFASEGARLLIVEDLHWADPGSAQWLDALVRRIGTRRCLLIASYRPGTSPAWLRCAGVTQLPLGPLAPDDATRLLEALRWGERGEDARARIVKASGGNPFLLQELALWDGDARDAPDTVQAVLTARIDELRAADKRVLQIAAVLGLRVRSAVLIAACDATTEAVRETLHRLEERELLGVEFDDAGDERIAFRHALVQESAYAMLLSDERKRLHARVVRLMDESFAREAMANPAFVALHCEQAGLAERAARLWQRAAHGAMARCAYVETARCAERGLALLPDDGPDERTSASGGERPRAHAELELALVEALGHAQMITDGYASATVERTWSRAEALCEELGDQRSLFRVLIGLSNYHLVSGALARAASVNAQLARIAHADGGTALRVRASVAMGQLALHEGRTRVAVRHFDRCLALADEVVRPSFLGDSSVVLAQANLAWARRALGEERAALAHAEQSLSAAHASDRPILLAIALGMGAKLYCFLGDLARAATLARRTIEIAETQGFMFWHGGALVTLGWTEAHGGDAPAGIETIERGIATVRATGERLMLPMRLGALADALRLDGRSDLARTTIERALRLAAETGERHCVPELLLVHGAIAGRAPDERAETVSERTAS